MQHKPSFLCYLLESCSETCRVTITILFPFYDMQFALQWFKECPQRMSSDMSGVNYSSISIKDLVPEQLPVWCKWIHFDYTPDNHTPPISYRCCTAVTKCPSHTCTQQSVIQYVQHFLVSDGTYWMAVGRVCHWVPPVQDILRIVRAGDCPVVASQC